MELSAGAGADSNSSPSTPLDSARSCHLLLLLPPLLPHRDSLPPASGTLVALIARSAAATTVAPLPPSHTAAAAGCESSCRMPMRLPLLTVFSPLSKTIGSDLHQHMRTHLKFARHQDSSDFSLLVMRTCSLSDENHPPR